MLPSVLRWNHPVNAERQAMVARALGRSDDGAADGAADGVLALIKALGQPYRLQDVGVRREHFPAIAKGAMQNMMVRSNPRPINAEADINEILEIAWQV
jgi:alcohol dehydrogenase class IV